MFWLDQDEGLMARVRNDAEAKDLLKILRGHLRSLSLDKAVQTDLDLVVEHFHLFILDVLKETPRPTVKLLTEAAHLAFDDVPVSECKLWSQRICEAISHCRTKRKQCTSGKRLPQSVSLIVQLMATQATLGEQLFEKARLLQHNSPSKSTKPARGYMNLLQEKAAPAAPAATAAPASPAAMAAQAQQLAPGSLRRQSRSPSAPTSAVVQVEDSFSSNSTTCMSTSAPASAKTMSPSPSPALAVCRTRAAIFAAMGVVEPECYYLSSQDDECMSQPSLSNVEPTHQASSSASTSNVPKSASASTEPKSADKYKEYVDSSTFTLIRLHTDQRIEKARMVAGPLGFLTAHFGTDATGIQTEIPNLMLGLQSTTVLKRPAAKQAKPRSKKQKKLVSDSEDAVDADDECAVASESSASSEHEPVEPTVQAIAEDANDTHDATPQYSKYRYVHAQTGNVRAYVQGFETETKKWKLLAEVSKRQSIAYLSVISDVHQQCIDMQLDKTSTKALATRLLTTDRYVHK